MPIDASIPLSYRAPQFETQSEVAARHLSLANLGQRNLLEGQQLRQKELEYAQERDTIARAAQVRDIMMQTPDAKTAIPLIRRVDPFAAAALEKNVMEREKADREDQIKRYEFTEKVRGDMTNALAAVVSEPDRTKWPSLYKVRLAALQAEPAYGQIPEYKTLVDSLPAEMPAEQEVVSLASQNPQTRMILENLERGRTGEKRTVEKHAAELPGEQATSRTKTLAGVGQAVGATRNQAELDAALAGQPDDVKALVGATWTPETPRRGNDLGMTAEQRGMAATQTTTRRETAEHNRAMEAVAQERNAIARGKQGQAAQTSRLDRLQREFDKFDADEQKWHGERERLGDILAAKNGEEVMWRGRIVAMDKVLHASVQGEFDKATKETERLYGLKTRKLGEMGKAPEDQAPMSAAPPSAQPPAQSPAPTGQPSGPPGTAQQYKPGDIVSKGGKKYRVVGINPDGTLQAQPI